MSIESLANELATAKSLAIAEVAEKIQRELDAAASSEQRGRVLAIFNMTMDQAERNLAARDQGELLEQLKKARAQYYKTFIVKECTVGAESPGSGDVSVEMLMAATNREIAAGRMTEGHALRRMAVEGAAAPHMSHAQLVAKHAKQAQPTQSTGSASSDKVDSSKLAYAFGRIVGRRLRGLFRE
jgi:hypothetical protein